MSLVGTECTLHGLGTVVAAEFSRHIDRLLRKHFEDLFAVRGAAGVGKASRLVLADRYLWVCRNIALLAVRNIRHVHAHTFDVQEKQYIHTVGEQILTRIQNKRDARTH